MNEPKLRFKANDGTQFPEWERKTCASICCVFTDGDWIETKDQSNCGIRLIQTGNVGNGFFVEKDDKKKYISEETFDKLKCKEVFEGDILISRLPSPAGRACIVPKLNERTITAVDCTIVRTNPNIISHDYFVQFMQSPKHFYYVAGMMAGGTRQRISRKNLEDELVSVPCLSEQQKIASLFTELDNLIQSAEKELEGYKGLKRGMLQKMFPKKGEAVPEIRFPEFTGDWKQCKLGDIYDSIGNAFVGTSTPYYVEQGHFYLESNNVKDGQINHNSEVFINDEFYEKQKDKWLHTGDMVMVQSGHVGHAAVIPEELNNTAAHALIMFRNPKEEIEPYFLNYEYQTDKAKKKIENITKGNTVKHILSSDMQEFVVDTPKYEEQKMIADYFRNIDRLIALQQKELDAYKELKKGLLQQMFC